MEVDISKLGKIIELLSPTQKVLLHHMFVDSCDLYEAAKEMGIRQQEAKRIYESTLRVLKIKLK